MKSEFFRVICPQPMDVGGVFHTLGNLKTRGGDPTRIVPTLETRNAGVGVRLEWDIPDTEFNRDIMARQKPAYKVIEIKAVVIEEVKKVVEVEVKIDEPKKLSPMQVKELKSTLKEELSEAGIEFSATASLKELQAKISLANPNNK